MAILKVRKSESSFVAPTEGWHEVTILSADRGMYPTGNKSKYIDLRFEEFPEQVKLRVHQTFDDDGAEWKILGVFRYANAGISEIFATEDGLEAQMNIDDKPEHLIGCKINVYVYKNAKGYTDISDKVAPTVFKNDWEAYDKAGVEEAKKYIYEKKIKTYIADKRYNPDADDSWDAGPPTENGAPEVEVEAKTTETTEEESWV